MRRSLITTAALFSVLAAASPKGPRLNPRNIITAFPEGALDRELKYKRWDDTKNSGADPTTTFEGNCRDPHQIENSNIYSRVRCNHGICAIMYDFYFEKDQSTHGSFSAGHKYDSENIVVFVKGDGDDEEVVYTAASCHHAYGGGDDAILGDGTHPHVVWNKDGILTHCFRLASQEDIDGPENYTGDFVKIPLLGFGRLQDEVPEAHHAMTGDWGGATPKIQDDYFSDWLNRARERAGDVVLEFNSYLDE